MSRSKTCVITKRLHKLLPTFQVCSLSATSGKANLISLRNQSAQSGVNYSETKHQLQIAIVGGGATGLSAALHLAPLVDRGIIAKPIHLYESKSLSQCQNNNSRTIGVGIWSTALVPFTKRSTCDDSNTLIVRPTHAQVIRNLEYFGTYLKDVGYRIPNGNWLVQGSLNTQSLSSMLAQNEHTLEDSGNDSLTPSLLFIRECDFLQTLRDAVSREERDYGTIVTHYGTDNPSSLGTSKVTAIHIPTWHEYQNLGKTGDPYKSLAGQLVFENKELSDPFHLIIAADGMNSNLRQKYGGYPASELLEGGSDRKMIDFSPSKKKDDRSIAIEDRNYTVFRGNTYLKKSDGSAEESINFQTWGEGKSMRFAAVSMSYPVETHSTNNIGDIPRDDELPNSNLRKHTQVWFATTSDKHICNEKDPVKQKEMLLKAFSDWHDPIERLIKSTPVENIIIDRGVAHRHSVNQVFNLSAISRTDDVDDKTLTDPLLGSGPILLFTGDACMTIDPVLAQGFTMGMESASSLASCLERCYAVDQCRDHDKGIAIPTLKRELNARQSQRYERIMCVLRATDLVQSLAQPNKGLSGFISRKILRPLFAVTPSFIKKGIFMRTIQYSLGILNPYKAET